MSHLSLAQSIAQRLMVGFKGTEPSDTFNRFCEIGLGGVLFFRHNVLPFQREGDAKGLCRWFHGFYEKMNADCPMPFRYPWMAIDQEGGRVERLIEPLFPTLPSPLSLGRKGDEDLAREVYQTLGEGLRRYGLNVNFCPTLDVNFNPENRVIGVRAYGDDPVVVSTFGEIAFQSLFSQGIFPVIKHFPGHGNGVVDSHEDLPTLRFTHSELSTFQRAIDHGAPGVLVAHGYYPDVMGYNAPYPSSLSKAVVQGLLREKCHFKGLIFSDDMSMGAIDRYHDPVEAAIRAMEAGIDILVYQHSEEREWMVFQGIIKAFEEGRLSETDHWESVGRIERYKGQLMACRGALKETPEGSHEDSSEGIAPWSVEQVANISRNFARGAFTSFPKPETSSSWFLKGRVLIIEPTQASLKSFAQDDTPSLSELIGPQMEAFGLELTVISYSEHGQDGLDALTDLALEGITLMILVQSLPTVGSALTPWWETQGLDSDSLKRIWVSVGTPPPYWESQRMTLQDQPVLDYLIIPGSYRMADRLALCEFIYKQCGVQVG